MSQNRVSQFQQFAYYLRDTGTDNVSVLRYSYTQFYGE